MGGRGITRGQGAGVAALNSGVMERWNGFLEIPLWQEFEALERCETRLLGPDGDRGGKSAAVVQVAESPVMRILPASGHPGLCLVVFSCGLL